MEKDRFTKLLSHIPAMSEAVNSFKSDAVQMVVFSALMSALGYEHPTSGPDDSSGGNGNGGVDKQSPESAPTSRSSRRRHGNGASKGKSDAVDINAIINGLKERGNWATINERVFISEQEIWHRIALIMRHSDVAMTSGEVRSALEALGIKAPKSTVSDAMKRNLKDLISDSTRKQGSVVRYRLSTPAAATHDRWLSDVLSRS